MENSIHWFRPWSSAPRDLSEMAGWVGPTKKEMGVLGRWIQSMIWIFYSSRLNTNPISTKIQSSTSKISFQSWKRITPKCSLSFRFYTKNEKESIIILRLPNENDFLSLAHGGERVAAQAALFTQFLDLIGTLPSKAPSVLLLQVWIYQPNLSWEEALKGKEVAHWPLHGWMPIFE